MFAWLFKMLSWLRSAWHRLPPEAKKKVRKVIWIFVDDVLDSLLRAYYRRYRKGEL